MEDVTHLNKNKEVGFPVKRHKLMENKETQYLKEYQAELELDKKLNLRNQGTHTQIELLKKDIEELTNSKDYVPVSEKGLMKLFNFKKIELKCRLNNFLAASKELFGLFKKVFICTLLLCSLTIPSINSFFETLPTFFNLILGLSFSIACVGSIVGVLYRLLEKEDVNWTIIKTRLKYENVEDTKLKLPKGAKLKLLEAKESELFESFSIIYPEVYEEKVSFSIPKPDTDPALVGNTITGEKFMICYWDIEKDIDRTIEKIELLKKFKV